MGKMEAAEQTASVTPLPSLRGATVTLRQLSTDQQQGWIERLFSRLSAMYGASFGRQWEGTNLFEVKGVWAEKLGGFSSQNIADALKACDEKPYPPNLPEFITFCRSAANRDRGSVMALAHQPAISANVDFKAAQVNQIFDKPKAYDFKGWAKHLRSEYLAGVHLLPIQISMASEALNETWADRKCGPRLEAA